MRGGARKPSGVKRIWVSISIVVSSFIIVLGGALFPSALGRSVALVLGLVTGAAIVLIAPKERIR